MLKETRLLILAARAGDLRLATRIIDKFGLSHRPDWWNGYKFLRIAAKNNRTAIVKFLLDKGCAVGKNTKTPHDTPLYFAVEKRNVKIIKLLLSKGSDVNGKNKIGKAPLAVAVEKGDLPIVELLLQHGANINFTEKDDSTPLHMACKKNLEEIAKVLLKGGADINAMTVRGFTPLHIAIEFGRSDMVNILVQHGAKVDFMTKHGQTALNLAVSRGDLTTVNAVLKCLPDITIESNQKSLENALCSPEKEKIVIALMDYGFAIQPEFAKNPEVLHGAVEKGLLEIVDDLLENGADPNCLHPILEDGLSPLHRAVENKHEQVVKLLISNNADVNAKDALGKPPIYYSVATINFRMTQILLSSGANVRDFPEVLHVAVRVKFLEILETLFIHGANVNARDPHGRAALHFTVFRENEARFQSEDDEADDSYDTFCDDYTVNTQIAQLLLAKGAEIEAQSETGETALHGSLRNGFERIVDLLLEHNANVHTADKKGITPLHIAVGMKHEEMALKFISKGAKVNAKMKNGTTPLHIAAHNGIKEMVELLLKYGANVNTRDENGQVPIHSACSPDIIDTLWTHGADVNTVCNDGKTAICYLSGQGYLGAVSTLIEYGADLNAGSKTPLDCVFQEIMTAAYRDMMFRNEPADLSWEDAGNFLIDHQVKMDVARFEFKQPNLLFGERRNSDFDLYLKCELELERIKKEFVENTNVSYYDILKKDARMLAKYMNNECMVLAFNAEDFRGKFSLYAGMIKGQFRRGLARMKLLEAARRVLQRLVDLPEVCTEKIMDELSDKDLRVLIEAGNCEA